MDEKRKEAEKFLEEDFKRRSSDAKKVTFNFYYDNEKLKEREDNGNKFVRDDKRADG